MLSDFIRFICHWSRLFFCFLLLILLLLFLFFLVYSIDTGQRFHSVYSLPLLFHLNHTHRITERAYKSVGVEMCLTRGWSPYETLVRQPGTRVYSGLNRIGIQQKKTKANQISISSRFTWFACSHRCHQLFVDEPTQISNEFRSLIKL